MKTIVLALAALLASSAASAHGGGLNADGCHTNRKTGDYHCHGGGGARGRLPAATAALHAGSSAESSASPLAPPAASRNPTSSGVFANCSAARAAGAAPVRRDEAGYGPHLDRDNDGIGCE